MSLGKYGDLIWANIPRLIEASKELA